MKWNKEEEIVVKILPKPDKGKEFIGYLHSGNTFMGRILLNNSVYLYLSSVNTCNTYANWDTISKDIECWIYFPSKEDKE